MTEGYIVNIIIFGASGGVGQKFTELALEKGLKVTAYVRNPEKLRIKHENLKVVQGDAHNKTAVENAIAGHDAVVSCLGSTTGLKKSTELEEMTRNIVDGMVTHGINRIIYTASAGIEEEIPGIPGKIMMKMLGNVLADHKKAVHYIKENNLVYTIARPMGLNDKEFTGTYREERSGIPVKSRSISRADVAHFLLKGLTDEDYFHTSVGIGN